MTTQIDESFFDDAFVFCNDFVFKTPVLSHTAGRDKLLRAIDAQVPSTQGTQMDKWFCDVNTDIFMPDRDLSMYTDLIQNGIYPAVSRMFEAMPQLVRPESSQVVDIWYNRYTPGAGQEIHTHSTKYGQQTRYLSGTYILELDEPNGTVFYNVNAAGNPMVSDLLHMSSAKEGDILLFPAHLPHYVKPCIKRRTTIAFNLSLVFPFEAKK